MCVRAHTHTHIHTLSHTWMALTVMTYTEVTGRATCNTHITLDTHRVTASGSHPPGPSHEGGPHTHSGQLWPLSRAVGGPPACPDSTLAWPQSLFRRPGSSSAGKEKANVQKRQRKAAIAPSPSHRTELTQVLLCNKHFHSKFKRH